MGFLKLVSQQYRAWWDCTDVQAGLALYCWQRLITFGSGRISVNKVNVSYKNFLSILWAFFLLFFEVITEPTSYYTIWYKSVVGLYLMCTTNCTRITDLEIYLTLTHGSLHNLFTSRTINIYLLQFSLTYLFHFNPPLIGWKLAHVLLISIWLCSTSIKHSGIYS